MLRSHSFKVCWLPSPPRILAPQVTFAPLRTGFHIVPVPSPFLAPRKWPRAGLADFFGQVGFGVAFFGHKLAKNAAELLAIFPRSSSENLS